ncbi:xanthine dehydrogenase molybdopterin binding subunit [Planctomycetota bacterium]
MRTLPGKAPAGKVLRHESAHKHVSGGALYVDDQAARRGGMLEVWPVCVPHARARLTALDVAPALCVPGVVTVITKDHVIGENDIGALKRDEPLFAEEEVFFWGQIAAVVVGHSIEACRAGAARVHIEAEPLSTILTIEEAVAASSFHTAPHRIRRGNAAEALKSAEHTLEGELKTGGQEHLYLEMHAAWAEMEEDGSVYISSSTQNPSQIQAAVARVLGISSNQVIVESPRMGGAFGGKETQSHTWAAIAALAARQTARPVRVRLTRDLDMTLTGKRHPFLARYRAGFRGDGRIEALEVTLYCNGGWAADLSEPILDRGLFHLDNAYYVPHMDVTGRVAKTNLVSSTALRGFGGPQGMLVIEEVLDRIARRLGLLPEEVRERNLYDERGERAVTHYGMTVKDARIRKIWSRLSASSTLAVRRRDISAWNDGSPHSKRGIAITPLKFGISFTKSILNQAGALVLIYQDGSVQVNHGGTEMGQGLYTKMRGVASHELGVPPDRIRMMQTRTDKVPNTAPTAASSGADLNGQAVKVACETLRERLAPVASRLLVERYPEHGEPGELVFADGFIACAKGPERRIPFREVVTTAWLERISLSATGFYRTPGIKYDKATGRGRPFHYFAYGAAVAEVEVDGFTGMSRLLRVDILHDVGSSLNPSIDVGQIEGGFIQGMGWLTMEELCWSASGELLTRGPSTYKIPAIGDTPLDLRVSLLPDAAQEGVIHGSKAVGEPPLMLAISVREAIREAIAAFGAEGGEVPLPVPATCEAIFMALDARRSGEATSNSETECTSVT